VTPTEIKVGLIYPDSGPVAEAFLGARAGVEARVGLANASGGVNGRQIVLDRRDDQGRQQAFTADARDLLNQDGAFGLIAQSLDVTDTAAELDRDGIPVAGLAGEPVWTQHRNMFTFGAFPSTTSTVSTFGLYAHNLGATRAVVVRDPVSASTSAIGQVFVDSLRSQAVQVVDTIDFTRGITNPVHVAATIRDDRPDALIGPLATDDFVAIYNAAKQFGVTFRLALNGSGYSPQLLAKYGSQMAGMSVLAGYTPFSTNAPVFDTYRRAMATYAPETPNAEDEVALASYVTTDEFIRGLELAGPCPTRQGFIDNLRNLTTYNAGGLIPTTDLSRYRDLNLCYAFVRVNQTGTAFDVVQNPGAPDPNEWCGTRIAKAPQ
jgi:ABC-type branched-subunit amino acid transport system substrate-binding protein